MGLLSVADPQRSAKGLSRSPSRPLREDHSLPRSIEKLFSDWKVLVGHDDWHNYYKGLEAAEKYRLHNLPSTNCFYSGVYELALYPGKKNHTLESRNRSSRSLKKGYIVPIYVGQAENVRNRLQEYGRSGSHLEGSADLFQNKQCLQCGIHFFEESEIKAKDPPNNVEEELCSCPHLFTSAFRQGYFIAFRWTATRSKVSAAALEAFLLQTYDYAWNRGSNGERRPEEAFKRLQRIETRAWYYAKWIMKLPKLRSNKVHNLRVKRIGLDEVKDNLWKRNNPARMLRFSADKTVMGQDFFTFWRRDPKEERNVCPVQLLDTDGVAICGIVDGDGVVCKSMPVPGRKRCQTHKGMRLRHKPIRVHVSVCGIVDSSGDVCKKKPVPGRKRCEIHKGMRLKIKVAAEDDIKK
ncbi:hypothetical protein KP509_20G079300 [Ceratopteris richardii]|uniref:GIY-YIG domain-containing protein n=1 Tax=Ceratopteris richardii TaxID=49495 RepID=A0A8T2SJZ0_CERRI|nr:hypothetical protein KP509_20G079300 [Ceratopteris richardii]